MVDSHPGTKEEAQSTGLTAPDNSEKKPSRASSETAHDGKPSPTDVEGTAEQKPYDPNEDKYVTGFKLFLIVMGMLFAIFLVALDQTIIATAIPRIASQFNALQEVTWIASAYFLTQAGLIMCYGQILTVVTAKWVILFTVALFEVGSVICGAAPNIYALIVGRAVAGAGAAGIFTSCLSILAVITRLEQRPIIFGMSAAIFALASVVGPLMGGALTDHVSWRWCFYINLPFGAITIATILLIVKDKHSMEIVSTEPVWLRIVKLDWIGTFLCVGMVTALLLPLQWGGITKAWTDKTVIACFVVFAVLLIAFVSWEWYMGEKAALPLSLFKNRTQVGCVLVSFFVMLVLLCAAFYLPLYYQSSEEHTATQSGIDILTYMITTVAAAMVSGGVINKFGRPLPFLIISPLIAAIGSGLFFWTLSTGTQTPSKLYGFQALLGIGVGGAMQNTFIAIQAEYNDRPTMVPQSTGLVNFLQLTGGIIGIAVSGTIFGNKLASSMQKYAPNLPVEISLAVRQSVAIIKDLSGDDKVHVLRAYTEALGYVFIIGIPCGILASCSASLIRNFNLKKMGFQPGMAA